MNSDDSVGTTWPQSYFNFLLQQNLLPFIFMSINTSNQNLSATLTYVNEPSVHVESTYTWMGVSLQMAWVCCTPAEGI